VSTKVSVVLASMNKSRIVMNAYRPFMGFDKPNSVVTNLLNHTSLLMALLWRVNEVAQDDGWVGLSRTKTSSWVQWSDFDLVPYFAKGCCTWGPRGRSYNVLSNLSLVGYTSIRIIVTLSNEYQLAHCCHLIVLFWCHDGWLVVIVIQLRMMLTTLLNYLIYCMF
jgi:hypothetical protein